ncbi:MULTISPECIES: AlpA family phage regulatory protein [unclassified Bradyrhizobium]|uniref:helix-turn-helix transcriptional regulator n=1 Tax=unclassified Bradyrhizobium TaxID=2631580 RepID=UPI00247AB4C2|nr:MULTISPECIES: AlpA family phage regulatory protein [unclassified Bradyrhizobium]WGS18948.1 AlpA family phage regulatory protein [Bradyrhizobium sp. ISRA463]WGS25781.1 AlpA family phage regulatory protein [Bradyrhizobium sp. ISRA464]
MSSTIAALSIPEAAVSAGVSKSLLYQLIKDGRGPRVTRIGCRSVIRIEDRDQWLKSLADSATP